MPPVAGFLPPSFIHPAAPRRVLSGKGCVKFGPPPGMGPGRAQDRTQPRVWMAPPETVTDV